MTILSNNDLAEMQNAFNSTDYRANIIGKLHSVALEMLLHIIPDDFKQRMLRAIQTATSRKEMSIILPTRVGYYHRIVIQDHSWLLRTLISDTDLLAKFAALIGPDIRVASRIDVVGADRYISFEVQYWPAVHNPEEEEDVYADMPPMEYV